MTTDSKGLTLLFQKWMLLLFKSCFETCDKLEILFDLMLPPEMTGN